MVPEIIWIPLDCSALTKLSDGGKWSRSLSVLCKSPGGGDGTKNITHFNLGLHCVINPCGYSPSFCATLCLYISVCLSSNLNTISVFMYVICHFCHNWGGSSLFVVPVKKKKKVPSDLSAVSLSYLYVSPSISPQAPVRRKRWLLLPLIGDFLPEARQDHWGAR